MLKEKQQKKVTKISFLFAEKPTFSQGSQVDGYFEEFGISTYRPSTLIAISCSIGLFPVNQT